ncbi:hypothetical protein H8E07_09985, partial [bacterium]|nr:hypothetical protein [bacterium]
MPLLESRRGPHPHLAALQRARRLTRQVFTPIRAWPWPATWAALLLAGLGTGEWSGGGKPLPAETSVRLACLTPLVMVAETRPAMRLGAAALTVALGWCAGGQGGDAQAVPRRVTRPDRRSPA